jgi:hypothetical protein
MIYGLGVRRCTPQPPLDPSNAKARSDTAIQKLREISLVMYQYRKLLGLRQAHTRDTLGAAGR